ncbi:MAG: TonB-dependent receptor plug domain-containing protein, partial [Rudaea sp.]
MTKTLLALAIGCALLAAARAHASDDMSPLTADADAAGGSTTLSTVQINATLDQARNQLSPDIGASQYVISQQAIQQLPLGDATPLNQVLLQVPGFVQDSYGQLHVRGDHADLQYRINGVIIPESISGFGQTLDTRLIDSVQVLTGALPAQYGYRTAGVVDITTKGGAQGNGGSIG